MLTRETTGGPLAEVSELFGVGIGIGIGIEWRRTWRLGMSSWSSTVHPFEYIVYAYRLCEQLNLVEFPRHNFMLTEYCCWNIDAEYYIR